MVVKLPLNRYISELEILEVDLRTSWASPGAGPEAGPEVDPGASPEAGPEASPEADANLVYLRLNPSQTAV